MPEFTKLDPRRVIAETLADLDMTIVAFAGLQSQSQVPTWTIERALRGQRDLDYYEARDLTKLARELRELRDSFGCNLDWRDSRAIKDVLRRRREIEAAHAEADHGRSRA